MTMKKIIILLVFSTTMTNASKTGQELLNICHDYNTYLLSNTMLKYDSSGIQEKNVVECISYIQGVIDMNDFLSNFVENYDTPACIPYDNSVTSDDIYSAVYLYLKNNQESIKQPAATLISNALTEKYSCSKSG